MRVNIARYSTRIEHIPGGNVRFLLGELLDTTLLTVDAIPRVGELITYHPPGGPSTESWTAEVTGVQYVVSPNVVYPPHVTVRDGA